MIKLTAIRPPAGTLSEAKYRAAVRRAQGIAEVAALQEAKGITRRWKHRVDWRIERQGDDASDIVTTDAIFAYQNDGTKAHAITPRRKRALFWRGARHPVRRVWHPGNPAMRYTDQIAATMQRRFQQYMNDELAQAAR